MNIIPINPQGATTTWEFFALTVPLTILSSYVIVAYQLEIRVPQQPSDDDDGIVETEDSSDKMTLKKLSFWKRVFWPVVLVSVLLDRLKARVKEKKGKSAFELPDS